MISRVAVVPHPPLLVPELTSGAAAETEPLRAACLAVAGELAASATRWVAVAADAGGPAHHTAEATGSFRGFGVDVRVSLSGGTGGDPRPLPLPVLIAGWLRERAGADTVEVALVPPGLPADECAAAGRALAASASGPVGLLVLGDGSSRHGENAVGRPDDRAAAYDAAVHAALAAADPEALLRLDADLGAELGAAGRAAWQVLAGAVGDTPWRCDLAEFLAPFGVGYHLALWSRP
ncbi:hypothetical protein [Umezawaea beigongshangensis]|uniref:hypothetical protein n=1 Tax=Umezawaea beigongshangensis TaxID=2780383 RepID=UPI0018F10F75|nr:hypothetical protein [Umezawaea beigongshangensis]